MRLTGLMKRGKMALEMAMKSYTDAVLILPLTNVKYFKTEYRNFSECNETLSLFGHLDYVERIV